MFTPTFATTTWHNTTYGVRQNITFNNQAATQTNWPLYINASLLTGCNSDFKDNIFYDNNGTLLNHYLNSTLGGGQFYINFPYVLDTTNQDIWRYCKNLTATSDLSNPVATFAVWERGQDGSLNTSRWYSFGTLTTITIDSGGIYLYANGNQGGGIGTKLTMPVGYECSWIQSVENRLTSPPYIDPVADGFYYGATFHYRTDFTDTGNLRYSVSGGGSTTDIAFAINTNYSFIQRRNKETGNIEFWRDGIKRVDEHNPHTSTADSFNFTLENEGTGGAQWEKAHIYNVVCRQYLNGTTTIYYGAEELVPADRRVSIVSPINLTYDISHIAKFYYNTTSGTSGNCSYSVDYGSLLNIGTVQNATLTNFTFATTVGVHRLNVSCFEDSTWWTSSGLNFSVVDIETKANAYQPTEYETNTTYFTLALNTSNRISGVNASLNWNNTAIVGSTTINGTLYTFTASKAIPLLSANTTAALWWNYTLNYTNGTLATFGIAPVNQTLLRVWYLQNLTQYPAIVIEGDDVTFTVEVHRTQDIAGVNASSVPQYVYFRINGNDTLGTYLNDIISGSYTYYVTQSTASAGGMASYNATVRKSYGGYSVNETTGTNSFTVYAIEFTNCSATSSSTTEFLRFTSKDELNLSASPTFTMNILFNMVRGTVERVFNFTFSGANTYPICIYPQNVTVTTNATSEYQASGYAPRSYWLTNAVLTNTSTVVYLYNLVNTSATEYTIYVKDLNEQPITNAIVNVQRNYLELNSFLSVAMGKTDDPNGVTKINLQSSKNLYKVIISKDGAVLQTFYPVNLIGDTLTFKISETSSAPWWDTKSGVTWSCDFNNSTFVLSCQYNDPSGLMQSARLYAWNAYSYSNQMINDTTLTTSSGTAYIYLGDITGRRIGWAFIGTFDGNVESVAGGYIDRSSIGQFKSVGLVISLVFILVLSIVGIMISPAAGIIGGLAGLSVVTMLGWLAVGLDSLMLIFVVGGLYLWHLRR